MLILKNRPRVSKELRAHFVWKTVKTQEQFIGKSCFRHEFSLSFFKKQKINTRLLNFTLSETPLNYDFIQYRITTKSTRCAQLNYFNIIKTKRLVPARFFAPQLIKFFFLNSYIKKFSIIFLITDVFDKPQFFFLFLHKFDLSRIVRFFDLKKNKTFSKNLSITNRLLI